MIWEATDEGVLVLLSSDAEVNLQVAVDLAKDVLYLAFANEDKWLGGTVDAPDVVAVMVSVDSQVKVIAILQVPLTCPELALVEEGRGNVLRVTLVAPHVWVLG